MIREDNLGKQRIFLGLASDAWPGLTEEDVGTRLFLTDRKAIVWWDGDQWVPATPGWFLLYQANPFVTRTSLNDATDDDFTTFHSVNMPGEILCLDAAIRVQHFWLTVNSATTKGIQCLINGSSIAGPTTTGANIFNGQSNVLALNGSQTATIGMNNPSDIGATANNPLQPAAANFAKPTLIEWRGRWTTQPIVGSETITLHRVMVEIMQ